MKYFRQEQRTIIWIMYLLFLLIISFILFDSPIPPTAEKGIWFYSCLASIILGDLITSPYFTSPADVISNSTAAIISLLAVNAWSINQKSPNSIFWLVLVVFNILILISSIVQILTRDSLNNNLNRLSNVIYKFTSFWGNHKLIFSLVVFYSIITFHINNQREFILIGLASVLIITVHPIEKFWLFVKQVRELISVEIVQDIGDIIGYDYPNIILIKSRSDSKFKFGDAVIFRGDDGKISLGCVLNQMGYTGDFWYRIQKFSEDFEINKEKLKNFLKNLDQNAYKIDLDYIENQNITKKIEKVNSRLVGLIAPNSDISKIKIELVRTDIDLTEGRLIETKIGSENVIFQIINGLTREELIEQKNSRGYVQAEAIKLGVWEEQKFKSVKWIPLPNTPVYLIDIKSPEFNVERIGLLPSTDYFITVDINELVTHNTAILGILGIGKTCLALELIERIISSKIKVICLDLTDEYEIELKPYLDEEKISDEIEQLNEIGIGGKMKFSQNKEEGGSITEFSKKLKELLLDFLDPNNDNECLKIYNPASFEVWRQTGGIYKDSAAMATLTQCEITKIFSEVTLEILQEFGISKKARCCLIYEEAHSLIPEWNSVAYEGDKAATNGSAKAILQGRKYGLGCLLITQRTANVTKSILNQCNTIFALRTLDSTGIDYLNDFIGVDYASMLSALEDRHAIIFGKASSSNNPVLINLNDRDMFLSEFRDEELISRCKKEKDKKSESIDNFDEFNEYDFEDDNYDYENDSDDSFDNDILF